MAARQDNSATRLDDAARAGWLYYVAGNTQEEIAAKMGISRQTAQRLVSLSISEGLIKVRLDHPIGRCLDLAQRLTDRFGLVQCEVVPSDPASGSTTIGVAEAGAAEIERYLKSTDPIVMAIGTGRTLKAAIEQLQPMDCQHHKVVSLTGNIAPDGSAAFYNVIFNVADTVKARSFPMPLPVIASSAKERQLLHTQAMIEATLTLAAQAQITFVGVGHLGPDAPLLLDGFITEAEHAELLKAGAVGEISYRFYDSQGKPVETPLNERVIGISLEDLRKTSRVMALAGGESKTQAIAGALKSGVIDVLVTDKFTAARLTA